MVPEFQSSHFLIENTVSLKCQRQDERTDDDPTAVIKMLGTRGPSDITANISV